MKNKKKVKELIKKALSTNASKGYWESIQKLRVLKYSKVYKECQDLIISKKRNERELGVDVLAQLGTRSKRRKNKLESVLIEVLKKEKNDDVVSSILFAIGHNNDELNKRTIGLISKYVNSKNKEIRFSLVFSLLGVEDKLAIKTLIRLSKDKKKTIRSWAIFGLGSQLEIDNKVIRKALWRSTNDKDFKVRNEAIVGLSKRGDNKIIKLIRKELKKETTSILIFESIEELINPDDKLLTQLRELKKKNKSKNNLNESWKEELKESIKELKKKLK